MVDYDRLCIKLSCALTGKLLPAASWHIPERSEQRIAIAVCEATGMTPERWDKLTKDERIPWLHKTLKALEKHPVPNVWIDGDDLPTYRPESARQTSEDTSPPPGAGGLVHFDLPNIFRCAVELAEATAAVDPSEWATLPVGIGPSSPNFERWMERHRRQQRIEEETERLKRLLGATGPLEFRGGEMEGGPKWESYDQRFNNTIHDRLIRLALVKLATAAIDLSGFATWREWQLPMLETGLRLLAWGLAQLWEGMSPEERAAVRGRLPRTHIAIGWPADSTTDPPAYEGPEEIPLSDQYRTFANYISCCRNYLDDVQKAGNEHVKQEQEKFLRHATLAQFVETAERAEQALQAMVKREFDTAAEWSELYTKAFWPLACLRRAHEIQPRESWPVPALEQRKVLADAAGILLTCVGGTPEAKATCNPEDANKAIEDFTHALRRLRETAEPDAPESRGDDAPLAGPPYTRPVSLEPNGKAMAGSERPSPFTISEPTFKFVEGPPSEPLPSRSMTVGGLIHNLTVFADFYERASADIDREEGILKPRSIGHRDANADAMQRNFRATVAIDRVRAYTLAKFGADLTVGTARRLLGDLIRQCALAVKAAEELLLEDAMDKLEAAESRRSVANIFGAKDPQAVDYEKPEKQEVPAPAVQAEMTPVSAPGNNVSLALLRVFTNGIADERIKKATCLLADKQLTVNDKLTKIDALFPFPATASAEQLGEMLGVTKQAVLKTDWWIQNRKGEKENEVGRRREVHRKRAKSYESPGQDEEND